MHPPTQEDAEDAHIQINIANHLVRLANDVAKVGAAVSELAHTMPAALTPDAILDLQKLDSVQQSLHDVALLSAAMALTGNDRARALADLKLSDTRILLKGAVPDASLHSRSVELF